MKYELLMSSFSIGELQLKNRVVMPAMHLGMGQFNGKPTLKMMNYYEERATNGVGLIITEGARVNDIHGALDYLQLGVSKDYHIQPLSEMISRIHKHDCKVFVQLMHPGYQIETSTIGLLPTAIFLDKIIPGFKKMFYKLAPIVVKISKRGFSLRSVSPSKTERNSVVNGRNRKLRKREIKKLVVQFSKAANRVKQAGADGVEIHAAHGYLIQQFLSPRTNHRVDEYGGTLENRMRFLIEIINGVRKLCGEEFIISVRLTIDEFYDKIGKPGVGYNFEEGLEMAKILNSSGIDVINVSSGNYETIDYMIEPADFEPGWRKYLSKQMKEVVDIPVIAANLIRSAEQAELQLQEGIQDFVAIGRPFIADPQWYNKVITGKEEGINECIGCVQCFWSTYNNAFNGTSGTCHINPDI